MRNQRLIVALLLSLCGSAIGQLHVGQRLYVGQSLPPASGGPFSYTNVPGFVAWWNPSTLSLAPGALVTNWPDASGRGLILSQTTQPTYGATYATNGPNGRAIVTPQGTWSALDVSGVPMPAEPTIFIAGSNLQTVFSASGTWIVNVGNNGRLFDWPSMGEKTFYGPFCVLTYSYSSGAEMIYVNGVPWVGGAASKTFPGSFSLLGEYPGDNYGSSAAALGQVLIYTNLSAANLQLVASNLCNDYGLTYWPHSTNVPVRVYTDGDSITCGGGLHTEAGGADSWPARMQALLGVGYEVLNPAVSGQNLWQMQGDAPMQIYPFHGNGTNVLFVWEYVNSLGSGAAPIANAISNYCVGARAAGWRRILVADDYHTNNMDCLYAGWIVKSNWQSFADGFVELDLDSLRYDTATNDPVDFKHPGANGWQIIATNVAAAVKIMAP